MSNAIQQIADRMLYQWEDAVGKPVKLIRIVIQPGDESMLDAFYDYMLAVDSEEEDMVFVIELPFSSTSDFSKDVVAYIAQQIEYWNHSEKPEEIVSEYVDWVPDYTVGTQENEASVAVANLNRLTEVLVSGTDMKCSFVFNLKNTSDYDGCREWFGKALALPFHPQMVWGISDIKGYEQFGKLMGRHSDDTESIYPPIDLGEAMEQLAEQAANEDKSDPAASNFRLVLIKLMNSVKKGNVPETEKFAKQCLDIALDNVKRDIHWISQFVTVYTILYTDQLARKDYKMAMYFADKAVEAAEIGAEKLDPSLACRLLGNTLLGKASIYVRETHWKEAAETYYRGAEAYSKCNDYLMQGESLRLSGWCREKNYEKSLAAECYVEGFRLSDKLSAELVRNSSYPLLLLSLLNCQGRSKLVSDDEINEVLTRMFGEGWENYLYEYKRNLGKYNGMAEQHIQES